MRQGQDLVKMLTFLVGRYVVGYSLRMQHMSNLWAISDTLHIEQTDDMDTLNTWRMST